MRPNNAPETAIPIPPGGLQPQEPVAQIHGIMVEIDRENANIKANFDHACSDWTVANLRNRDMNLPLAPKPVPPSTSQLMTAEDADPQTGIIWIWQVDTQLPSCPDLPAIPVRSAGHVHIQRRIYGAWFAPALDDTYPSDGAPVVTTSDDGVSGTFAPVPGIGTTKWYQKVA